MHQYMYMCVCVLEFQFKPNSNASSSESYELVYINRKPPIQYSFGSILTRWVYLVSSFANQLWMAFFEWYLSAIFRMKPFFSLTWTQHTIQMKKIIRSILPKIHFIGSKISDNLYERLSSINEFLAHFLVQIQFKHI